MTDDESLDLDTISAADIPDDGDRQAVMYGDRSATDNYQDISGGIDTESYRGNVSIPFGDGNYAFSIQLVGYSLLTTNDQRTSVVIDGCDCCEVMSDEIACRVYEYLGQYLKDRGLND